MTQHTQGRLFDDARGHGVITGEQKQTVATANTPADSRRLVAAWNACEGLSTQFLEECTGKYTQPLKDLFLDFESKERELAAQRDELLNALRPLITKRMGAEQIREGIQRAIALAAIAKVESCSMNQNATLTRKHLTALTETRAITLNVMCVHAKDGTHTMLDITMDSKLG